MREKPAFPPPTPRVSRISHSRLETYLGCGVRYQFRQELRYRRTTVALARGGAVDEAATYDNRRKLEDGRPAELADLIELAVLEYEAGLPGGASQRVCSENCEDEGRQEYEAERRTQEFLRGIR